MNFSIKATICEIKEMEDRFDFMLPPGMRGKGEVKERTMLLGLRYPCLSGADVVKYFAVTNEQAQEFAKRLHQSVILTIETEQ